MAQRLKVLLVEDNPHDAELELRELGRAGFEPVWERVDTEEAYLASLDAGLNLILSDFAMPAFDGLSALRLLNQRGWDIPFIIVSGTIGEETAVAAMKEGAADYLLKDRLARLGPAVGHALTRARLRREGRAAEQELREKAVFITDVMNSLTASLVVLDEKGVITAVNEVWRRFARENGGTEALGQNYLEVCMRSVGESKSPYAQAALTGIRGVLQGTQKEFSLEYPCHSPQRQHWFVMNVSALTGARRGVVIAHEEITRRKQADLKNHQQLEELLRWQEVMLGREDRVLALKAQVNELLAQQKQPPRYAEPTTP